MPRFATLDLDPVTGMPRRRQRVRSITGRGPGGHQPDVDYTPAAAPLSPVVPQPPQAEQPIAPAFSFTPAGFAPGPAFSAPQQSPYATYGAYQPPALAPGNPPAAGSLLLEPAFTPDYRALIEADPNVAQYRADLGAQDVADRAALAEARRRSVALFGEAPAGVDLGGDITPEARTLAEQNTAAGLSTVARLQRENEDAVRAVTNQLAARGLLRSGETGFQLGRAQDAYRAAQFDARQRLIDHLTGAAGSYADTVGRRSRDLANALAQATSFQATLPQNQPRGERRAYLDQASGLYRDDYGQYYTAAGERTVPPAGAAPAAVPYPVEPTPLAPTPVEPGLTPVLPPPPAPEPGRYRPQPYTFPAGAGEYPPRPAIPAPPRNLGGPPGQMAPIPLQLGPPQPLRPPATLRAQQAVRRRSGRGHLAY